PRFPHACHHHAASAFRDEGHRAGEPLVEAIGHGPHRLRLHLEDTPADLDGVAEFGHGRAPRADSTATGAGGGTDAIARTSARKRGSQASGSMVAPSEGARSGCSWTSRNRASIPKATAARARPATYWRSPPERVPSPPGSWTEWVASKTTGVPRARMTARPRRSTTRLW